MDVVWPAGAATGIGSMPGTEPLDASMTVAGELPVLGHLPELPARGPGAGMVGRAAAMLVDLHVDLQPSGWRVTPRGGLDEQRARDLLSRDLDALEIAFLGYDGLLKVQVTGPWTLAAGVELTRGDRVLRDPTAWADLHSSLAEGVAAHVAEVARRVPAAAVIVQLDEPSLPAVGAGHVPTASGFGALPAIGDTELTTALAQVGTASGRPYGVHCCAARLPWGVLRAARPAFVSFDVARVSPRADYDDLAGILDDGARLLIGLLPGVDTDLDATSVAQTAAPARRLWRDLSYPPEELARRAVLTPACGLAGASPTYARAVLTRLREAGRSLAESPEEL
ncbi:MAG TPA: methionine synthase [Mycobacteriales bacterium]|nr:methionine synthase [Mycobacteriales bacterium]